MKIDMLDICYEAIGEGEPIILLHGWGASKETFKKLSKELSNQFRVYCIDLPGFGESEIGLPLNVYEVTELIYKFVVALKIDNPILLGHSYGGRIAIIYSSKYKVKKLILVSSAGIKNKLKLSKRIKIKVYKSLKKMGIKVKMGSKDYLNADNVKRAMLVNAVNTDLTEEMKKISIPTLLIYGNRDDTTPLLLAHKIEENINNSVLIIMEDCGHFLYLEKPTIFLMILNSFLLSNE
ncbi:MAG: alpha/beta fold hydrolase [Anaeroplasma sp.]